MRIPSGDLAPARRGRRRGGFGRKRRNPLPVLLAVVLVVAVAVGAYLLTRGRGPSSPSSRPPVARCPSPAPPAAPSAVRTTAPAKVAPARLPAPGAVSLRLLNGTNKGGQARAIANQLVARRFKVTAFGNAPRPLAGASTVTYGPGAGPGAQLVASFVPGARLVPAPKARRGSVDVVLGSSFTALRSPAQAAAAARGATAPVPAAPPAPSPAPVAAGSTAPCR